jgi:ATP-binding cassette subfamily C protein LapB
MDDTVRRETAASANQWVEPLLMAARSLGLSVSPEWVRGAASWATRGNTHAAVLDIAAQAGLSAQFVEMPLARLSPIMLPALLEFDDGQVGLLTDVGAGRATVLLSIDGKTLERPLPTDGRPRQLLLVHERTAPRKDRVDDYLTAAPDTWLRNLFTSHWKLMLELCAGSLFGNLLAVSTALFSMQVWDRVVPARSTNTLWVLASGVALALLLELVLRTARVSLADHFGKRADLQLSSMFFARVLDIRNDARPRSPGSLIAQLRDLEQLRELLTSSALGVLIDLPFVLAFLVIIWVLGGWLVLVPLAAIPLLVLPGILAQYPLAKLSQEGMAESALRNAILMESIYRAEDIKTLQAEPRFRQLWEQTNQVNAEIGLKQRHLSGLLVNFSQTVQQIAYAGVIIAGVYAILDASLSFGAVMACSMLTSRTIAPLGQIPAVLSRLQNARVGKQGLDKLLALPTDHATDKDTYHKPVLVGRYEVENVAYSFGPEEKPVLTIPRLSIKPGERIAILGRVGAGKSTLLRMLAGLATPQQGRVMFNDTPMPLIDVADVRRDVGTALQESSLFYGSLRENLLLASPLASDEELLAAMKLSCADQLLLQQPHGLDLMLRENGVGLSGGQKQALVLARTFLRAPHVLLLDEPTASLDEGTERAIIENMRQWLGGRTLIVATHRFPLLSLVDRVIVIDGGRIVRDGPREQVLASMRAPAPQAQQAQLQPQGQPKPQATAGAMP